MESAAGTPAGTRMAHLRGYCASPQVYPRGSRGAQETSRRADQSEMGGFTKGQGKMTRRASSRATRVTVKTQIPWQTIPEMGEHAAAAPRLGHPGYALAASRPGAKGSLLPRGIGTWGGGPGGRGSPPSREPEPGGSAAASPRAGSRGNPATWRPPPPVRRVVPPEGESPAGGRGQRGTGGEPPGLGDLPRAARGASRAPARASRRARAGGAGGGRAAIVAGLPCSSSSRGRAAGAAPSPAGAERGPGVAARGTSCCGESTPNPSRSARPLKS